MSLYCFQLNIPVRLFAGQPEPDKELKPFIAEFCDIAEDTIIEYEILSKSIDARRKPEVFLVYQLRADISAPNIVNERVKKVSLSDSRDEYHPDQLKTASNLPDQPIVVGTGPAGLMAALLLAQYGCKPIILERGRKVEEREQDIDKFYSSKELDPESNFLFGEGGAGTYSDGKLYTRTKDPRIEFILKTFVEAGAPEEILYLKKPHIGSDRLPQVIRNIRKKIESMGGTFLWGKQVEEIIEKDMACCGVKLSDGETMEAPLTIIAPGHSARKLIKQLLKQDTGYIPKDFQLGCRIEHKQSFVDYMQYGVSERPACLGAAEYNLVSRPPKRLNVASLASFCMCPGGEIIPATSSQGQLSTNGMSKYARSGDFANSGLIVNQNCGDFDSVFSAFDFIDRIEKQAFEAGGGDFVCPAQGAYAFFTGEQDLSVSESSYKFGLCSSRLDSILPPATVKALKEALKHFEKIAPGFMYSGTLVGVETRVSSPVRFFRNPESLESSFKRLYIAGEGAGYASGIISAALDGLRIAEKALQQEY